MKIELNRVLRQNYILKSSNCSNYNENNQLLSQQIKDIEEQLNSTANVIESKLYEVQRLEVANCKQQTRLIAQLKHLQTECRILCSYKNIISEILLQGHENILQVQSCTERHHNSILNQSDYQPRDSHSVPIKQLEIDSTFQKKRLLAFRQILKEEGISFDAKTDDEINQFVREMPKTSGFWVRVGQMCEIDSKKLRENFNSQYKLIQTNGQNSTLSSENEQTENSDQVILETHLQTTQNQNESNYHLNEQENQISYSCKSQINRTNMNEQQIISERDLIEQLTQAFQLILKEAGYTINGDDQLWIWQAVKSLSTQQRNQLKLWNRVVQICKLRDNKVAQQFFKQQCRKLYTLQNETNDHSQQQLNKQNSEVSQDQVCCQDNPNEVESIQCEEEIQGITRESQVQFPDTQIVQMQSELTEKSILAELQEQDVKAQESQPVLENEFEPEINIQTGILEQKARDLKTQIQVASAQFQDEQLKLKLAHETVKQLSAQSDKSISQSTLKVNIENIGVQMKNDDYLPHAAEQPGQQHGDRKELLEQEIQHLQKQLELANKKVRNEQYKLKLVNETIANLICQNQQKTSEQNTLGTQQVLCVQQESVQKDIQESCSLSHQNLANDSHLSIQNQKSNLETSFNQLEPVPCDQYNNGVINNQKDTTAKYQNDTMSNQQQRSKDNEINIDQYMNTNQSLCQKNRHVMSNSLPTLDLEAMRESVDALVPKFVPIVQIQDQSLIQNKQNNYNLIHKLNMQAMYTSANIMVPKYIPAIPQSIISDESIIQNTQNGVQLVQQLTIHPSLNINTVANTLVPNFVPTTQFANKPIKQTNSECKLRQQIPFALKKVLADSGYNVKNTTEKELCALVMFMNFRQKTKIDLWNRVAQLCDVNQIELQKFFIYHYSTILYSDNEAQNKPYAQ
ncbi:Hypothetical_protein [Hexamita inflata]|uniref:Hypothetical_protein n=1 Tax=Hexamita inflata TaxID=28002 RepID=A0AA86RHG2_9EUKA|nr:Hypothetical protein HINF_LOCUS62503 [Hexamita inflata]